MWQGYLDSNQGMAASKAAALPLGDSPTVVHLRTVLFAKRMVRKERLELSHLAAPEPKSGASTNSATSASGNFTSCDASSLKE
ncbi:Putative RNA [Photobacterium profundum 3TCK]|jgi:hypothetical protein|uniref:RNA n=1 Tax=Photobacterium profundum 3TCK TaxID=314280 RepID=Q1YYL7_9GAMM|nr:Putative RNA [Photobacterium profundum 3TCK]EAS41422.1 Putative RNA [Photobacterium profundum 3TCK]